MIRRRPRSTPLYSSAASDVYKRQTLFMVAKINTPHRLLNALNYNEKKVQKGKAECIYAGNYLQEANKMNFYQKLERFENLNKLNDRATTKTVHISLNFDPQENLSKEKLIQIA